LADSPASVWLILLALVALCFGRLAKTPRDITATLALLVAALVTVLLHVSPELPSILVWLLGRSFLLGAVTAWLAFALLPGRPADAAPSPTPAPAGDNDGLRVLLKAVALVAILGFCILLEDTSAIIITLTVTNMLVVPDGAAGATVGRLKLLSNFLAFAAALPVLILVGLRPEPGAALLLSFSVSLALAAGASRGGARGLVSAMAMPVLFVLLGLYLPKAVEGEGLAAAAAGRAFDLCLAVGYGLAVHALLRPPTPEAA
jgi:hypothetical protein